MFSSEENELLTRVGPETPMGTLFRRYWVPALLSEELPEPDCAPVRVRLLGEDLVAFRDSRGRVGLLDENCSHRRASLFYARNEECGLRCVYHGWKYDVEGNVLDTPTEPAGSTLTQKVQHPAYPCKETAGVVFTYMGPKEKVPPFPNYEWLTAPSGHVTVNKFILECNYLQSLEGDCDPAHLPFLHLGKVKLSAAEAVALDHQRFVPALYDIERTDFGIRAVVTRMTDERKKNVRVSNFVMPFIGCVPVGKTIEGNLDGFLVVYQTPADDYQTVRYNFRFQRHAPLARDELDKDKLQIGPSYRLRANSSNDYLIDRQNQKTSSYTGIPGFRAQDACMTESMGRVTDRTKERLGSSDTYVIALRRYLLKTLVSVQRGEEPPGLCGPIAAEELNCTDVMVAAD